jgi:hypothetical protein
MKLKKVGLIDWIIKKLKIKHHFTGTEAQCNAANRGR